MQEYHDGLLLFEECNSRIWEPAAKDTLALTTYFKKNKNAKTCLALLGLGMAVSLISAPLTANLASEIAANSIDNPNAALDALSESYLKHMVLIDIISDTVFNIALMAGIWFRIKTLKH